MNNTEQIKKKNKHRSEVSRRLLIQYCLCVAAFIVGMIIFIIMAWQFCAAFTWYPDNPIYLVLNFIKEYILLFTGIAILAGWLFITLYFISKPFRYLDEVVTAAEKLVSPTNDPIILSDAMSYTETELNRVREKALNNARAAKEAEQRKNDLVVYLAHDLKTPLTSVIGYLTLLHDEKEISETLREKYISISLEKAEHLEDLINEFFEITRFNLSSITLEYSKVNLTRMLEQLTFEFMMILSEKNLKCDLDAPADIMIKCDVNKMQRVFDNLLRNAANYSFENSTIHIIASQNENNICIKFINSGNTLPKDKLKRIFEQFYRLDSSRNSKSGGAGLGLAIAKEIVELHGGAITAESENEIIEFKVILPLS